MSKLFRKALEDQRVFLQQEIELARHTRRRGAEQHDAV
ncbi:hypothetical protein RKD52_002930 [Metabacillus sp. SLBN-84]